MKVGNRSIGPNEPPLVIAEIGINRGGDLDVTKNMVDLIAGSGGECVKHQTHSIEDEMTEETKSIFPPNTNKSKFAEK
jgi:N-acetylneuraminate synthase